MKQVYKWASVSRSRGNTTVGHAAIRSVGRHITRPKRETEDMIELTEAHAALFSNTISVLKYLQGH
jgi:hypothetical protein